MTFTPTDRDWQSVDYFEREIKCNPDKIVKCRCFDREEARWVKRQLKARGHSGRFYTSWLVFPERLSRVRSTG